MPAKERARAAARWVWGHPRYGLAARAVVYTVSFVALVELIFGRDRVGHVAGMPFLPFPTGIGVGIFLNGAIIGTLYALVAFGLILVYRANRIINFAQAGLGSLPALLGILLVTTNRLSYPQAFLVMLVGAALAGAITERVLLDKFRRLPRMILTVATIGIAQIITLGEVYLPDWVAGQAIVSDRLPTPFSSVSATLGYVVFTGDHLAILIVAAGLAAALTAFFKLTRLGLAVRASAENADRARLLGIPAENVSTVVWMIAAVLSGVAVFLRAPVVGVPLGASLSPYVMLFALAAAVLARMQSLPVALAAGMAIGVVEQAAFVATSKPNLAAALMLPILLGALVARRGALSRAHDTGVSSFSAVREFRRIPIELAGLPEVRLARGAAIALGLGLLLGAPYLLGGGRAGFASQILLYAMVGLSLVVLSGWAGQISLGQFGLAGVGAAVAGGLAANYHVDFFVTLVAAALAGAVIAFLIGVPALRIPGLFLAVVTLAFAVTVQNVLLDSVYMPWLLPDAYAEVARPLLWGRVDVTGDRAYYYVCLAFLALAYGSLWSLRRSRSGRVFISVRDNVRAAQSYGISSARTKLAAFALSGAIAAVAGALFAYQSGAVSPDGYALETSLQVFIFTVVGGLNAPLGAVAGAIVYLGLKYLGPSFGLADFATLFTSTALLFVLVLGSGGLAQAGYAIRDRFLRRVAARRGVHVPSLVADGADHHTASQLDQAPAAVTTADAANTADTAAESPASAVPPEDALLVCRSVDVAYDGVQVLFGVNMHVRRGEVLALLGTNGAGKSTLLKAVSGLVKPRGGTITFDGRDITSADAVATTKMRVVQVPGGRGIFPTLTVAEHFRLAAWTMRGRAEEVAETREEVLRRFPQLAERRDQLAGDLSGGEQQQLALGMAFLLRPELLIVDELSLGLAPALVEELLDMVREVNARGTTVLLVEQSVTVALSLAERAYFMEKGEVRFEGPTAQLLERDDIVRAVFLAGAASAGPDGQTPAVPRPAGPRHAATPGTESAEPAGAEVLAVRDLSVAFGGIRAVDGVNLTVHEGQITGLIGPNGAGKTTIFDLISGFVAPASGRVYLDGRDVTRAAPDERARAGLGRSFQDARIFASMTVAENIAAALERHLAFRDHLAAGLGLPAVRELEEDVAWSVADLIDLMHLGAFRNKFVSELSTGTRRVVDLAMALAHDPRVVILDEPSSGIAQRETEELIPLLLRLRDQTGCAMLVIEHDMPLVTAVSDHLVALDFGRIIAEGPPRQVVNDPAVVAAYLGKEEAAVGDKGAGVFAGVLGGQR